MINKIYSKFYRLINSIKYSRNNKKLSKNCDGEIVSLGNKSYGSWTICSTNIDENSIIYSFGVGEDLSFDLELIERFGSKIFAFDPTPKSIEWVASQTLPSNLKFYPWGIEFKNGEMLFYPPENPEHASYSVLKKNNNQKPVSASVYTLDYIMEKLNHKKIDILKMDIEGSEYKVIDYIMKRDFDIKQILVEFHDRFESVKDNASQTTIKLLETKGYKLFHVSRSGEELSFYKK